MENPILSERLRAVLAEVDRDPDVDLESLDDWIEFLCELREEVEIRLNAAREDSLARKPT